MSTLAVIRHDERLQAADLIGNAGEWEERALCAQVDGELFFPDKGESNRPAKRICARCEVRTQCLEYALENDERFGVWGGLSEKERTEEKKRRASRTEVAA